MQKGVDSHRQTLHAQVCVCVCVCVQARVCDMHRTAATRCALATSLVQIAAPSP